MWISELQMGIVKISRNTLHISKSSYPATTAFTLHQTKRAHAVRRVRLLIPSNYSSSFIVRVS